MITKALLALALILSLALGWLVWSNAGLKAENKVLEANNAALTQARDQAREAYAVADAHRRREAARVVRLQASVEALLTGEFQNADDTIDPFITRHLECLRRAGGPDPCPDSPG